MRHGFAAGFPTRSGHLGFATLRHHFNATAGSAAYSSGSPSTPALPGPRVRDQRAVRLVGSVAGTLVVARVIVSSLDIGILLATRSRQGPGSAITPFDWG